ncbi:tetratricopeptide repeat protein [Bradyrhizobium sp. HKCCYLRH3099]|uniref:tetratricopeptide repeat protein n=1 Tax=unclassified Bradyrhizobium TaxID=2631580 RepID=UPI003EC039EF
MRTSDRIIFALMLGIAPLALPTPSFAFDGAPVNQEPAIPVAGPQAGAGALRKSMPATTATTNPTQSLTALQYAAEEGHPVAQFKLGRMYAAGDGVARDDMRAFDYFSRIANAHAEDSPSAPQAQIVANAFVALGRYYLSGIPNSKVKADPDRAREMFSYAASYFGNADAQYDLARLYLKTADASREDFRYGARWLGLAAQKGQHQAQALLGQMLFNGDRLPRQPARGLMWLTLARDSAGPDEAWIKESYNRAFAKASDDDRATALQMLESWVQGKRE